MPHALESNEGIALKTLHSMLENIERLPAMPAIAQKLLALPLDTDAGEARMLELIAQDPQIAAKVVGLANAPLFGIPRKVTAVTDAAMLLGLSRVKSISIGIASMSALSRFPEGKFKGQNLWVHSMAISLAMRALVRFMPFSMRPGEDQLFLAGLLHDFGYLILAFVDLERSDALHDKLEAAPPGADTLAIERELLDMHHGEIGALLAQHWSLPEEIEDVIHFHHEPARAQSPLSRTLCSMVCAVEHLLPDIGMGEHTEDMTAPFNWDSLGIAPEREADVREALMPVLEQARQLIALY